jgi:hypothetical protein
MVTAATARKARKKAKKDPPPAMRTVSEAFNPSKCLKILEEKAPNRDVNQGHVQTLVRKILNGEWVETHQGVAFDVNGKLIDGQHRLWAVVESDKAVRMRVTYNVPAEAMPVIDDGKIRSLLDVARLDGFPTNINLTSAHTSCAKFMMQSQRKWDSRLKPSKPEALAFLHKYLHRVDLGVRLLKASPKRGLSTAPLMAVVARAADHADEHDLARFVRILHSGVQDANEDVAAILLRNWIQNALMRNMRLDPQTVYRKAERALRAFLDREVLSNLYEAKKELFKLDGE